VSDSLTCEQAELLLGVLVLGAIDPAERASIELHLAGCERCTATLAEIAVLPGLMHRLEVDDLVGGPAPLSPEFTARVLAAGAELTRVERGRRRRRMIWLEVAAVLVLLLSIGVPLALHSVGGTTSEVETAAQGSPLVVSGINTVTRVSASVAMVAKPDGTSLSLTLQGVEPGENCRLVAVNSAGERSIASSWIANYEGEATVEGHTALGQAAITSLVVETNSGRPLVTIPVTHA
jgi:hypothetical protein